MSYKDAWDELKCNIDQAVEEGILCGFNKDDGSNKMEHGMYRSYERIQNRMKNLERYIDKEIK